MLIAHPVMVGFVLITGRTQVEHGVLRAWRTVRPASGSWVCVLATRGTSEAEEFARRQMRHLAVVMSNP